MAIFANHLLACCHEDSLNEHAINDLDEKGRDCHLYYELAERIPYKAAPIFMNIEANGRETSFRLPQDIGQKIRDVLDPEGPWEII